MTRSPSDLRRVAILDVETTGLSPRTDAVIEIGCVVYSLEHHTVISCWSTLVRHDSNAAEHINGIPAGSLLGAVSRKEADAELAVVIDDCQAAVAHNASFDSAFLPGVMLPWVCTKADVTWPKSSGGGKLIEIALAHGLGLSHAHRALTDCMTIARLFERVHEMGHDVAAMLGSGLRPKVRCVADVSYDEKHLAKVAGFSWNAPAKRWEKTMAEEDIASLPFHVRVVNG